MNKPLIIRQIAAHVAAVRVTPFRLRTVDAARLLAYVSELEGGQHAAPAPRSVALEPEERVLAEMGE